MSTSATIIPSASLQSTAKPTSSSSNTAAKPLFSGSAEGVAIAEKQCTDAALGLSLGLGLPAILLVLGCYTYFKIKYRKKKVRVVQSSPGGGNTSSMPDEGGGGPGSVEMMGDIDGGKIKPHYSHDE